mmetsp:Transcript_10285/g.26110  ORF Transcript_10285/g.26110 Transcript_10285/m.26110 type:complete len:219 (+) Transcript_10285:364-1020(+)
MVGAGARGDSVSSPSLYLPKLLVSSSTLLLLLLSSPSFASVTTSSSLFSSRSERASSIPGESPVFAGDDGKKRCFSLSSACCAHISWCLVMAESIIDLHMSMPARSPFPWSTMASFVTPCSRSAASHLMHASAYFSFRASYRFSRSWNSCGVTRRFTTAHLPAAFFFAADDASSSRIAATAAAAAESDTTAAGSWSCDDDASFFFCDDTHAPIVLLLI